MTKVQLFLFGSPRLEIDGLSVKVDTRKTVALLAYLGMMGESYRRDSLVNLLWPEFDVTHGRGVLRRTLAMLNDVLPTGWVAADRETIGLSRSANLWVDVNEFRRLLAVRYRHAHAEGDLCPGCQELLSQAAALYHEDFMSGFSLPDSLNFDDWQVFQAEGLRRDLSDVLKKLAVCLAMRADFHAAIQQAHRRLALDPLDEDAHRALIQMYAWAGQRSAALHQYSVCKETLQQQLGVEPQVLTTDLWRAVETGQLPALAVDPAWQSLAARSTELPTSLVGSIDLPLPAREDNRLLSVLVCKVKTSMRKSGAAGGVPAEGAQVMARFLPLFRPILDLYGGKIDNRQEGTVLAAFGMQRNRESSPELALRAALEIRAAADQAGIRLSAGAARGGVLISPELEREEGFSLSGAAIEDALKLANRASYGQILAAESIYQACRRIFEFSLQPAHRRLGTGVQPVYLLERLRLKSQWGRQSSPARTSLVGREKELAVLRNALDGLRSGVGQMVCLTGAAGLGKSRLVEELYAEIYSDEMDQAGPLWLVGRGLELSIDTGYWLFVDLLKSLFSWQGQSNSSCSDSKIGVVINSLVATGQLAASRREEIVSLFCRLLSQREEDSERGGLAGSTPEELLQLTYLALRDFLIALALRGGLVLVFEDLHWADDLSLDLISMLMESLERVPIFLLCIYRADPEYRTAHLAAIASRKCRGHFSEINLTEFTREESYQLVGGLLKSASLAPRIQELIWERCQGNPFFIEEILQSLIDARGIYQEDRRWKTAHGFDTTQLPLTIRTIILERLDHLEEDGRLVLQTAAVIGFVFRRSILEKALTVELDLEKALWDLEGSGFIYRERSVPEVEYSFYHVLMQEAIYDSILRHRRKMIHQRTAAAIEALYANNLEDFIEPLAYHSEQSGNIHLAIHYLYLSGAKARAQYFNEAAITYLTRGLELLRSLPESMERNRQELDYLVLIGVPLVLARGHTDPRILEVYDDALRLCRKTGNEIHLSEVLLGLRRYYLYMGPMSVTLRLSHQILDLAEEKGNIDQQARACMMLAEVFYRQGEFRQAFETGRRGEELALDLDPRFSISLYGNDTYLGSLCWSALSLWHLGLPDQARWQVEHQLERSQALSHPFTRVMVLAWTAMVYIFLRKPHLVQRLAEEEVRVSNERGFILYQSIGAIQIGWALGALGQTSAGLERIEKGLTGLRQMNFGLIAESEYLFFCDTLLRSDQAGRCLELIETSLESTSRSGSRELEADLLRLKGEGLSLQNKWKEAEQSFLEAIHVARVQSSRGFELRAATSLARLWLNQGRHDEAKDLLYPLYTAFTEGFDTIDLQEAKALLERAGQ